MDRNIDQNGDSEHEHINVFPDLTSDFTHRKAVLTELGPHIHPERPKIPKESVFHKIATEIVSNKRALTIVSKYTAVLLGLVILGSFSVEVGALVYQNSKKEAGITYVVKSNASSTALGSDEGTEQLPSIVPNTHYQLKNKTQTIKVTAPAYLVGDIASGEIIIDKGEDIKSPMASVSKLMTAVITIQNEDLHHLATVSRTSYNTFGSQGELKLGEKLPVSDLLYPLLVESSNDAAEVLAEDYGRDQFMGLMNEKAKQLGMNSTFYDDPSGLSPQNVSTVSDLFKLTQYVKANYPQVWDITRVKGYTTRTHAWINENQLLNYSEYAGGKNGYIDEARWTTATLFNIPLGANGEMRTVAIILLRSENRSGDVAALLQYLKKNVVYDAEPASMALGQ